MSEWTGCTGQEEKPGSAACTETGTQPVAAPNTQAPPHFDVGNESPTVLVCSSLAARLHTHLTLARSACTKGSASRVPPRCCTPAERCRVARRSAMPSS